MTPARIVQPDVPVAAGSGIHITRAATTTARVTKAGKRQVFATAELHADGGTLVANATAVLVPLG